MTDVSECNCGNCTKYSERPHPAYEGNIICFCGDERTQIETRAITRRIGCMLHPRAREVLMADLINSLESLSKAKWDAADKTKNVAFSYEGIGVDEAIEVIRNGGVK